MAVRTALTGGERKVTSPMMICEHCSTGMLWPRELLDVDEDGFPPRLRELSVLAGFIEPFEPAAEEVLGEMAGVKLGGSKVHSICRNAGAHAQELMDQRQLGEGRPLAPREKLCIEIDGGMLHIEGEWHDPN
jgi:hypothetical protein